MAVVYLASSLALAALELLVHIDFEQALNDYVAIPADFDDALTLNVMPESLPEDWQSPKALPQTRALGDAWVSGNASTILRVPSTVVVAEANYLLNPNHPDAPKVQIGEQEPFRYDPRLLKK